MAEKFPPIENLDINGDAGDGDFLEREKAALGDEFATEDDKKILEDGVEDEVNQFQSQFPDINSSNHDLTSSNASQHHSDAEDYTENAFASSDSKPESSAVKQWREKRDVEIAEKDRISEQKHKDIVEEARGLIDQFYEDYNAKKEVKINQVKEEEAAFIAKRDDFFKNDSSIWDRTIKLIDLKKSSGTIGHNRDKTRFKDLLLSLKGNSDAPGAGGY